jgi:hypothetical protein
MKWLLGLMLVGAAGVALMFVPPKKAALATAHGLRDGWHWLTSLGPHQTAPHTPPRHPSRKAQAAARRTSREGIVAQPPKERLQPSDRAALDALVQHHSR